MSRSNPYAAKTADEVVEPEETIAAPTPEPEQTVPTGSVAHIKEWVGESKIRAVAALKAEKAGKNRSSLIEDLERLV